MRLIQGKTVAHSGGSSSCISPIRWVGGKTRAIGYLADIIPDEVKVLVSPFFGGGSLEILAGCSGIQVFGYDFSPRTVTFWENCLTNPRMLADRVMEQFFPMSEQMFNQVKAAMPEMKGIELAAAFYAVNRSCRSGNMLNGGFNNPGNKNPINNRYNQSGIDRLAKFSSPGIVSVQCMDYKDSIRRHPSDFLYLDPPYDLKDMFVYDGHDCFSHEEFARIIKARGNWICCYGDCELIRKLYHGYKALVLKWEQGCSKKPCNEIVILSSDFRLADIVLQKEYRDGRVSMITL
jgi:site-specific DNA-adenine methylase